jgi:hypothetical protein
MLDEKSLRNIICPIQWIELCNPTYFSLVLDPFTIRNKYNAPNPKFMYVVLDTS